MEENKGFKMKGASLYGKINLNRGGYENMPDGRAKSSALQHNDPKAKKKHDFRFDEPENQEAHEAWHKKNTPGFTESGDGERDFSKHNTNARETEGTIEEQKALQEANKPK
tara:strand:+ start:307 stop:639 length:333 start_codon:yes stop_codon:yes gene_type:complete